MTTITQDGFKLSAQDRELPARFKNIVSETARVVSGVQFCVKHHVAEFDSLGDGVRLVMWFEKPFHRNVEWPLRRLVTLADMPDFPIDSSYFKGFPMDMAFGGLIARAAAHFGTVTLACEGDQIPSWKITVRVGSYVETALIPYETLTLYLERKDPDAG
jgi:hypothetical protein